MSQATGTGDLAVTASFGRSRPDEIMRWILRVPDERSARRKDVDQAHRIFGPSILLSALRCLLTYVVFPILTPLFGYAAGVQPYIGIPLAVFTLIFDALGIRRFFVAEHKHRWSITVIYLAVMGLVAYLLVGDITKVA